MAWETGNGLGFGFLRILWFPFLITSSVVSFPLLFLNSSFSGVNKYKCMETWAQLLLPLGGRFVLFVPGRKTSLSFQLGLGWMDGWNSYEKWNGMEWIERWMNRRMNQNIQSRNLACLPCWYVPWDRREPRWRKEIRVCWLIGMRWGEVRWLLRAQLGPAQLSWRYFKEDGWAREDSPLLRISSWPFYLIAVYYDMHTEQRQRQMRCRFRFPLFATGLFCFVVCEHHAALISNPLRYTCNLTHTRR